MGCYFLDLLNIARNILVQLPSSFFSMRLVSVRLVHPYCRMDTTAAWKKFRFILSDWFDLHTTDNLSIAVHAFASHVLMSFSVDETLLSREVNLSTNFKESAVRVEMSICLILIKAHVLCFVRILQTMLQKLYIYIYTELGSHLFTFLS